MHTYIAKTMQGLANAELHTILICLVQGPGLSDIMCLGIHIQPTTIAFTFVQMLVKDLLTWQIHGLYMRAVYSQHNN